MNLNQKKVLAAFEKKILGIRNYSHEKREFFESDFLDIDGLDYFLGEVTTGDARTVLAYRICPVI